MRQFAECLEVRSRTGPGGQTMTAARDDLLGALRQLKDPRLKPLFAELAASKRADFRRHGILGLAELTEDKRLNVLLVAKLESAPEQAAILREAMQANLIAPEQIGEILAWPGLEPYVELVLRLRRHVHGGADPKTIERFRELTGSASAPTAVMAKLCLAQAGEAGEAEAAWKRASELEPQPRAALVLLTLEVIRNERMDKAEPFASAAAESLADLPAVNTDSLRTLLAIAPERGTALWIDSWREAKELSGRLRLALIALEAGERATPAICEALEHPDNAQILTVMGAALRAVATGSPDAPAALAALVRQDYRTATAWALERALKLPSEQRIAVARAVIDLAESRRMLGEPVPDIVVPAAASIAEIAPESLLPDLRRACENDDDVMAQALLTGALRTGTRPIWSEGAAPRWPDTPSESLALLYECRAAGGGPLTGARRDSLRHIATGRGSLPDVFKVQAAWLVLAADGRDQEALARLLSAAE